MLRPLLLALVCLLCPARLGAQNRAHPGLVALGDGQWGTPAQAAELGLVPCRGQWYPKRCEKDIRKWEREDAKEGLDWTHRYRTKSKYYRIETNVPRARVELEIKPFLDALFETYVRVFEEDFGLKGKAAGNKDIRIYDGFNTYSVNEPEDGKPRPRNNPGFIVSGAVLVVYYDETDPGVFYSTVFHEGAHQFFKSLLPAATPPKWLTEALATYFEGCTYSRATNRITPGFVPFERLQVAQAILKSGPTANAEELFLAVPDDKFLGREYALAWSFVHYLVHRPGEKSHQHFVDFVQETNGAGSKPAAEIFTKATGEDLAQVSAGWRDFVLGLKAPESIHWVGLHVTKAGPGEELRSRDLLWSLDGVEVYSGKQFDELWKARPKDRPFEVVVVRCEPDMTSDAATRRFVRVTLQPGSSIELRAQAEVDRHDGLAD